MAHFVHSKQVLYRLDTPEVRRFLLEKYNLTNSYDLPFHVKEIEPLFWYHGGMFDVRITDKHEYLSFILYHVVGVDSTFCSRIVPLTQTEQQKYKPLFDQILGDVDPSKLFYADICWHPYTYSDDFFSLVDDFCEVV